MPDAASNATPTVPSTAKPAAKTAAGKTSAKAKKITVDEKLTIK